MNEKSLFDLISFLVSSARCCVDEPPLYASFRLLDTLERLIELSSYIPHLKDDPFLKNLKKKVEENKFLVLTNPEEFKAFLDKLVVHVAKELKRRTEKD